MWLSEPESEAPQRDRFPCAQDAQSARYKRLGDRHNVDRTQEVRSALQMNLKSARQITDKAKAEARGITREEEDQLKSLLTSTEILKAEHTALLEGKSDAEAIKNKINDHSSNGWRDLAAQLVKASPGTKVTVPLSSLISVKAPTSQPTTEYGISRRPGIDALTEDLRYMFRALPTEQLNAGVLHIESLRVASHGVASGSVERADPTSTTTKAEVDVDIDFFSVDTAQFAATCSNIPSAILDSEPALQATLQNALQIELYKALALHTFRKLDDDTGIGGVVGGSNFQTKIRKAVTQLRQQGASPDIALISDSDDEAMSLLAFNDANLPRDYPFGLNLLPSPLLQSGEFFVMEKAGVVVHLGSASTLVDPYSGMDSNKVRIRMEFNGLTEVIAPKKILGSAASGLVT